MVEYATLAKDDGTPTPHAEARRSYARFQAALKESGGRPPRDSSGRDLVWSERLTNRGWVGRWETRTGRQGRVVDTSTLATRRGLSLDRVAQRQAEVQRRMDHDDVARVLARVDLGRRPSWR